MPLKRAATPTLIALRAHGLGDFLTAVPAYRALAAAFPEHRRYLAAPEPLAALLPLVPVFDALLPIAALRAGELGSGTLQRPDVAVNLHGRGPLSHRWLLRLQPARLISFAHPDIPESEGGAPWLDPEHEVARWCRLLQEHDIPADPGRLSIERPPAPRSVPRAGYTLIHPGAAHPARRWPVERWAAVARGEMAAGKQVVVTGGPNERTLVLDLAQRIGLNLELSCAADGSLYGLASLVARADLVLCGDTGVAHLATALRRPSVVLFGPTSSPARRGPPPNRGWHRVLWAGSESGSAPGSGLLQISVIDVEKEIAALRRGMRLQHPFSIWGEPWAQSAGS